MGTEEQKKQDTEEELMVCRNCNGKGAVFVKVLGGFDGMIAPKEKTCLFCNGTGKRKVKR